MRRVNLSFVCAHGEVTLYGTVCVRLVENLTWLSVKLNDTVFLKCSFWGG